jgi:hypothetical protein
LLLAAANETGLLAALETALASCTHTQGPSSRLAHLSSSSRGMLVLTLLFLGVVGLRRTWDLRGYTGEALALLSGRKRAYGYFHTERLLSQMAQDNAAETLTDALAAWTARLWQPPVQQCPAQPPPSTSMATANQSTPRCSSREDWWDVSRRSRDVEHSSFFTTITVIRCLPPPIVEIST